MPESTKKLLAKQGKDVILMFRDRDKQATESAKRLAYQTTHTVTESTDSDSTVTKDGPVNSKSALSTELECEAILSDDKTLELLEASLHEGITLEIWSIDMTSETAPGKYSAVYMQGTVSENEVEYSAEDLATASLTFAIDGISKTGEATLSDEDKKEAGYDFVDVIPQTSPDGKMVVKGK